MSTISGLGGFSGGYMPAQQVSGAANTSASQSVSPLASSQQSTSVNALTQNNLAVISNNELLGAVLLMLMLEYMQSKDDDEKKGLLGLMGLIAGQQQNASGSLYFSSSSIAVNMDSLQMQSNSMQTGIAAYNGSTASMQQAPFVDPGAGGLNVVA